MCYRNLCEYMLKYDANLEVSPKFSRALWHTTRFSPVYLQTKNMACWSDGERRSFAVEAVV